MPRRIDADTQGLKAAINAARREGRDIGFVPTMGSLHQGHLSLVKHAADRGDFTVVSVFVNKAQFGPNEDFDSYPRDEHRDTRLAYDAGADLVWVPAHTDLYPPDEQTRVNPGALAQRLCGLSRPRFFGGICTVVLKLFQLVAPDRAYFGAKDFQQLRIIQQMVRDFFLDVEVIGCPIIREPDGLAMSSRNARIKPDQRSRALTLVGCLRRARAMYDDGHRDAAEVISALKASWPSDLQLDYMEFRDPISLDLIPHLTSDARLFLGAWLGGIRLIDNGAMDGTEHVSLPDSAS